MTDVEDKIKKIDLATTGQKIRRAIIEALEALNIYALPEPTEDDVGKTLVVDENGEWVIGDLPGGGGVLRPLKKIGIVDTLVPLKVRLTVREGEGNMAIVDVTNAKIEVIKPVLSKTWLGFNASGEMTYKKDNTKSSDNSVAANYNKSESATTGAIVLSGTPTWAGTEIYISTGSSDYPLYKVSGISFNPGDTLALTVGVELEG